MEEDPVEAIEKALAGNTDLGDYEGLAEIQLTQLQRDYEATLAANIVDEEEEEVPEPGYDVCESGSEEEQEEWGEMQSAEVEPPQEAKAETSKELSGDQVKRIKEAMQALALPAPAWALHLSDETFLRLVSDKLRP